MHCAYFHTLKKKISQVENSKKRKPNKTKENKKKKKQMK